MPFPGGPCGGKREPPAEVNGSLRRQQTGCRGVAARHTRKKRGRDVGAASLWLEPLLLAPLKGRRTSLPVTFQLLGP